MTTTQIDVATYGAEARAWLEDNAPRRGSGSMGARPQLEMGSDEEARAVTEAREFQGRLAAAGFAGITWPVEYGGRGLTGKHQAAFGRAALDYVLPTWPFGIGLGMCAPTLLAHGTEDLKSRYVPKLISGEEIWSQLFSEPGAGSDVAGLQTRAVPQDDVWVLNGQKVWTTGAHYSDYGAIIARTDPDIPKHQGITMFVVDLHAPGVSVRPLRQITGEAHFNEVFFDDVQVPNDHVLGEVNQGWRTAMTMLMHERQSIGGGGAGGARRSGTLDRLIELSRNHGVRDQVMGLYVSSRVLGLHGQRMAEQAKAGKVPGPEYSMLKLAGSRISQASTALGTVLSGPSGIAWESADAPGARWSHSFLQAPSGSIAGGTDEVLLNILGERVLGLPKEPQVDRDIPFKDIQRSG